MPSDSRQAPSLPERRERRGLLFFPPGKSSRHRRRRLWFGGLYAAVTVGLVVPVVPGAWRSGPLILGLPPAFAWVIVSMAVMFAGLLWLYRAEE